jgi:phosphotransferase system  glucose/maltose/N-acetylglucosamine-specific IIC component
MRYRSSIPFVVGLLLAGAAFAIMPWFISSGPVVVTGNPLTDSSWDVYQPTRWDFRIPAVMAVSGMVLMVIAAMRVRRSRSRAEENSPN